MVVQKNQILCRTTTPTAEAAATLSKQGGEFVVLALTRENRLLHNFLL